jgi:hypothetical protein
VEESLHIEAYKIEQKSSKTNGRSTHKKPTSAQNHERNRANNRLHIKSPKRTSKIEQKRTNRKLREEANKSGDQSPKSRQQERNTAFIAAQIAASNWQKSCEDQSKEANISSKWSFYCSPMQPKSTEITQRPIQRSQHFEKRRLLLQPILQPNAAFYRAQTRRRPDREKAKPKLAI